MYKPLILLIAVGVCLAEIEIPNHPNNLDDVPAIKERCQKKGKVDSYDRLKQAINDTKTCVESKINPTQVKTELEEAKKTGSMDEVFGKYCKKRPEIKDCILKTVNVTKECLEDNEKTALDNGIRIVEEILDFACFRDGDRLAMFVAEGGMECLSSRTEKVRDCVNATLQIDTSNLSFTSIPTALPTLSIDKKKCDDFGKIQECVVADLEQNCNDVTPANIVDALFKYVKKISCKNIKRRRSTYMPTITMKYAKYIMNMLNFSSLKDHIENECKKHGSNINYDQLWESLNETRQCLLNYQDLESAREELKGAFRNCIKNLILLIENCFSNEGKYLPNFLVESAESLMDFTYTHLDLLKISPNNAIAYCLQRLKYEKAAKELGPCTSNHTLYSTELTNVPTKIEICQQSTNFVECVSKIVKKTCTPDILIDQVLSDLKGAVEKPCM